MAIVGHSVMDNLRQLAIRDPSLAEDLDLVTSEARVELAQE